MYDVAVRIVQKLQFNNYTAYFAGGFARDYLLKKESDDIDIVTSATPDEVEKLFSKTIPVGKKFGIIVVIENGKTYEVATFRKEDIYTDSRRPDKVQFTDEKTDAIRRDFTVNGMFFDPIKKRIIDYVRGQDDVKRKTIRFIGEPVERIEEDNLRLLRAIRFKITLGFQYDQKTFDAVRELAKKIRNVSAERIRDELNKIMKSENRHLGLIELSESGLLNELIPEIERQKGVPQPIEYHHEGDVFTHTYLALKSLGQNQPSHLAWAVLLHDIGKPETLIREGERIIFHDHARVSAEMAKKILERLKFPRFEINEICWLIEHHMSIGNIPAMRKTKQLNFLLDPKFDDLIDLAEADAKGTYPVNLGLVETLKKEVQAAKTEQAALKNIKPNSLVTGNDLIKVGLIPGEKFKIILDEVNDDLLGKKYKDRDDAISSLKKKYGRA